MRRGENMRPPNWFELIRINNLREGLEKFYLVG